MLQIAPSILSADFSRLGQQIHEVERGGADLLHLDIMDGHFVPNITMGPPVVKKLRQVTELPFDVHLMIENPDQYIKDFALAGANIITVHQEVSPHLHRTLQLIRECGVKSGVALNPSTPLDTLNHVLEEVDMVLIMTVNPGFGGQKLIKTMKDKIRALRNIITEKNLEFDIQVDGGIKLDNIQEIMDWGANIFVAGSAIFNSKDIANTTKKFKETMLK